VITDPAVVNSERAATDIAAGPQNNSNLPDIGLGALTTLGGSANSGNPGGLWSFLEGIDGKLALLTNYIAGSFGTGAVWHSPTPLMEAPQTTNQQWSLTRPHP